MQQLNRPSGLFITGIIVAVFLAGQGLAQEKADWKGRFFAEAPKRWEDYLRFARSLQITVTANENVNVYDDANRLLRSLKKSSARVEFKQTKGSSLRVVYRTEASPRLVDQKSGSLSEAEAEGTNPSYSFKLKRRSADRGWIITDLKVSDQPTLFNDEQKKLQEKHLQAVCYCLTLENLWLPTLIQDPDFRITAIKPKEIDGLPVIRFDFDYPKPDKDYPNQGGLRIKGGWMALDPEHDWILREYLVHTGHPEERYLRQTFHIREGTDRHPILTRDTYQRVGKGEQVFGTIEAEWEAVERWDVPLEVFTLSAFGLPEPPGIPVERSRWHIWIAVGGIVCLGIAALIRWASRRARETG